MSVESDLRAALLAYAPLVALVPPVRLCMDAVAQGLARPYIAISKQGRTDELGLDGTALGGTSVLDVQCIGADRRQALQLADLVRTALRLAGQPSEGGSAGYDPDNDIEAEVVTVNWLTG